MELLKIIFLSFDNRLFSVVGSELLKIVFLSFDNRSSIILSSIESFWRLEIVAISIFGLEL
ncbi:MAG: hypothetical protein ACPL1F_04515 [bacterium]